MSQTDAVRVQVALDAAIEGDVEPSSRCWPPTSNGGASSGATCGLVKFSEVVKAGSSIKPGMKVPDAEARVVASSEVGVVVALRWQVNRSGEDYRQYEALKLRDGLVYEMKDYREERAAARRAVLLSS